MTFACLDEAVDATFVCLFFKHFPVSFISSCIMILGPRERRDVMYPGPTVLSREKNMPSHFFPGNVPSAWRSSQTETQDVGPRDLCTLGTTGTHRHHPFCSLMSHGGPSPGSSAGSFQPGSGLGSSCPKGSLFLILVLMTSDRVLPPKDTPEPQELHGTLCQDPRPQFLIRNIFKYL